MRGNGADQIPAGEVGDTLPWGLRLIDGTCNNIVAGQGHARFRRPGLPAPGAQGPRAGGERRPGRTRPGPGPVDTSYTQTTGTVFDSQPRVISNLIVDQTADNPAAVDAAGENPEVTPSGAFFIPNVAPDVGLSAPYNSWFTLFGQFFDHGLDLVNKGGNGTVFMPLQPDDPLFVRRARATNFMVLTRAHPQRRPRGEQPDLAVRRPEPDLHLPPVAPGLPARVRARLPLGDPQATGGLITGAGDGMATWADVKAQAATMLGIALTDADALSIPLLATDPYGRFVRGPNGFPQIVVPGAPGGLVEGDPTTTGGTASRHADATPTRARVPRRHRAQRRAEGRLRRPTPDDVVTPGLAGVRAARRPDGLRQRSTTTRCSTRTSSPVTVGSTRTSA